MMTLLAACGRFSWAGVASATRSEVVVFGTVSSIAMALSGAGTLRGAFAGSAGARVVAVAGDAGGEVTAALRAVFGQRGAPAPAVRSSAGPGSGEQRPSSDLPSSSSLHHTHGGRTLLHRPEGGSPAGPVQAPKRAEWARVGLAS